MRNFKMIGKMYREIAGLDKGILPVDFFCAILTGAKPFVNIWFTAKIIGMMTAGADFKGLLAYILVAVALNFVLDYAGGFLSDLYDVKSDLLFSRENFKMAEKLFRMDYEKLEQAITPATKAVMPVDVAGVLCDYSKIYEIVEKKKELYQPSENPYQKALGRILVLADCAHGFGAEKEGKKSGRWADFTSFSFHAVKNLTTAEGGAVVWKPLDGIDSAEIYREYMLLSLHGQTKDALSKTKAGAWEYDILFPAYKCNMTDIQAAIGLAQLDRYEGLLKRRQEIIARYNAGMDKIAKETGIKLHYLPHKTDNAVSSGHLYLLRVEGITAQMRNDIIQYMGEKGVAANVHYKPLPLLTAYKNMGFDIKNYPNAYALFENAITLPLHTKLTDEEVKYVTDVLKVCIG